MSRTTKAATRWTRPGAGVDWRERRPHGHMDRRADEPALTKKDATTRLSAAVPPPRFEVVRNIGVLLAWMSVRHASFAQFIRGTGLRLTDEHPGLRVDVVVVGVQGVEVGGVEVRIHRVEPSEGSSERLLGAIVQQERRFAAVRS